MTMTKPKKPEHRIAWKGRPDQDRAVLLQWEKGNLSTAQAKKKIEAHNGMPPGSLTDEQLEENAAWLGYHRKHWKWKED